MSGRPMARPRVEMIAETRAKLIAAARQAFGAVGYAEASMDDFTAEAGLTRGALYHHFGDKKGLLQAVIQEIQRIMFRDGTAVLGDISQWPSTNGCIQALSQSLRDLQAEGEIGSAVDIEVTARLVNGASSHAALWIANSDDPEETSARAVAGFRTLLEGLRSGRA